MFVETGKNYSTIGSIVERVRLQSIVWGSGVFAVGKEKRNRTQDYTSDIESAIRAIRTCERIITSSLHGLIIGDADGVPSVWAESGSTKGLEFKFQNRFIIVVMTEGTSRQI